MSMKMILPIRWVVAFTFYLCNMYSHIIPGDSSVENYQLNRVFSSDTSSGVIVQTQYLLGGV